MFAPVELEGIVAIVFSLSIPIVAVVCVFIASVKNKRSETELRKAIIENHLDAESIKLLVEQPKKKSDKYSTLRNGCLLVGIGLGTLADYLLGLAPKHDITYWLVIACGMGIGLLTSFIIEYRLTAKDKEQTKQAGDGPGTPIAM